MNAVPAARGTVAVTTDSDSFVAGVAVSSRSAIVSGASTSSTFGRSSSVMVNVTSSGAMAAAASDTVPDTVTCLSAVSTLSSTAVTVTAPVLPVAVAAKLSTVFPLRV